MYIFSNKSLNRLHLQYGFIRLGGQFIGTFEAIILYNLGYPLWQAILFGGMYPCGEFLFRFIVPPILSRFGLKKTILFGAVIFLFVSPSFYLVTLNIIPVWVYILLWSASSAFYWYPFHMLYGLIGDQEKRGRQSAVKEGMAQIVYSLSPILGGVIFKFFGAPGLFLFSTISFIFALIILLKIDGYPKMKVTQGEKISFKNTHKQGLFMNMCLGFHEVFTDVLWVLVLFFLFNKDTVMMGGLLSFMMILRIGIEYFVGRAIDLGNKTKWYQLGAVIIAIAVMGRTFFGYTVDTIILLDILLMLGYALFSPYASVFFYNSIKESKNPQSFSLLCESGEDFGSMVAYILAAILVYNNTDIRYLMPIGVIVLPFVILLYRGYFKKPLLIENKSELENVL